jgi:hypothetical protein
MLESISKQAYGQSLIEVQKPAAPEPIRIGEKRKSAKGSIIVAARIDGGRVYWKYDGADGLLTSGWTGTQSWRRMELA